MDAVRQQIGGLGNLLFKQAYLIGQMLDGNIPDVYVQSSKYWEKHKDRIRDTFNVNNFGTIDSVALHIRRGDYLDTDFYVDLCATDYYEVATKLFPGKEFIIFCKDNQGQDEEDRKWVAEYLDRLIPGQYEFSRLANTETDDLNLMMSCKHLIMANSSFSWWGAFLNKFPGKRIICPKNWFTDGVQRIELLPDWHLL